MKRNLSIEVERNYAPEKDREQHDAPDGTTGVIIGFVMLGFGCFLASVGISAALVGDFFDGMETIVFSYILVCGGAMLIEGGNEEPRMRWYHAALLGSIIPVVVGLVLARSGRPDPPEPHYRTLEVRAVSDEAALSVGLKGGSNYET